MAEVTDQPPAHRDAIVVTYDPEADAAYISFAPTADGGVARTVSVDDEDWLVNLDLDDDGRFVGMEVLGAPAAAEGAAREGPRPRPGRRPLISQIAILPAWTVRSSVSCANTTG